MADQLKDKVAIVTGAGSIGEGWGNGKAVAVLYAREGAKVLCADVNPDAAQETTDIIADEGGAAAVFAGDVTKSVEVETMVAAACGEFGWLDVLHNNVGVAAVGARRYQRRKLGPGPGRQPEERFPDPQVCDPVHAGARRGAIVNVSSIAGERCLNVPYISYAMTKAAMIQMTRVIAAP